MSYGVAYSSWTDLLDNAILAGDVAMVKILIGSTPGNVAHKVDFPILRRFLTNPDWMQDDKKPTALACFREIICVINPFDLKNWFLESDVKESDNIIFKLLYFFDGSDTDNIDMLREYMTVILKEYRSCKDHYENCLKLACVFGLVYEYGLLYVDTVVVAVQDAIEKYCVGFLLYTRDMSRFLTCVKKLFRYCFSQFGKESTINTFTLTFNTAIHFELERCENIGSSYSLADCDFFDWITTSTDYYYTFDIICMFKTDYLINLKATYPKCKRYLRRLIALRKAIDLEVLAVEEKRKMFEKCKTL